HRFFNTTFWTTEGGDFSPTVSASQSIGSIGSYAWSSAQMVADVQSWLDNQASNFGWLVLGDESTSTTARRFDTRESASPPVLTIEYAASTPTPTPTTSPTATPTPTPTSTPSITPTPTTALKVAAISEVRCSFITITAWMLPGATSGWDSQECTSSMIRLIHQLFLPAPSTSRWQSPIGNSTTTTKSHMCSIQMA